MTGSAIAVPLIAEYTNGGYRIRLHADGTKVREAIDVHLAPVLPEQMDLKITDWCDAGCAWCHEKSTPMGKHGDVTRTLKLLKDMPVGAEIAIGGGDPLSHPEFERLVRGLRGFGLVPSVTVNGRHFARHRATLEKLTSQGQLYGVGISYHDQIPDWDYEHMVLHVIAGVNAPAVLANVPRRLKVLVLGYKQFGRGKKLFELRSKEVQDTLASWYRELFWVAQEHHLSFDNLAIEQLKPGRLFKSPADYLQQYMGQEGQFSMYVDAVTETFALSSYAEERTCWSDMQTMFESVRRSQGYIVAPRAPERTAQFQGS